MYSTMLKNSFPKKYIFKAFDTVVSVVYLVLDVGRALYPTALVMWAQAWPATSLTPKCPLQLVLVCLGRTVFTGDRISGYADNLHDRLGSGWKPSSAGKGTLVAKGTERRPGWRGRLVATAVRAAPRPSPLLCLGALRGGPYQTSHL